VALHENLPSFWFSALHRLSPLTQLDPAVWAAETAKIQRHEINQPSDTSYQLFHEYNKHYSSSNDPTSSMN